MSELRVALVPVGRMDLGEVDDAGHRVARVLGRAVEIREPAPLARGAEDPARGQYRSAAVLAAARSTLPDLKVRCLAGSPTAPDAPVAVIRPDATVFVADVDLFTPTTSSVFEEVDAAGRVALVSVRRLREAFYRRKADPAKQRARLAKEALRLIGTLKGLPVCRDPGCVLSPTQALADIDRKGERYCSPCWKRLTTGTARF